MLFFIIRSFKALDTLKRDKLGSCRLSRASFVRSLAGINGGNVPSVFFLVFLLSFFLSFLRAAGEITYRETVESVRNGSFIGRVGALARTLESARVGEDFDERAFPVGSRGLPFDIHSHARKLGEPVSSRRVFPQAATKGNGSVANQPSTVARIWTFSLLETLILKRLSTISFYEIIIFQLLFISSAFYLF